MRFVGVGLILVSCGSMGLIMANSYRQRVLYLRQLVTFIQFMESEIFYARATLPELIGKQKNQFKGIVKDFLNALDQSLELGSGEHFSTLWEQGVAILERQGLPGQILEDFRDLGRILGVSDVNEQVKHVKLLLVRLEKSLAEAEIESEKHTRLWQYLGFSTGLFLVLLLL